MFRLEKNQIHIVLFVIIIASALIFLVFGIKGISGKKVDAFLPEMEDFSNGWICSYDTDDAEKVAERQKKIDGTEKTVNVTEILSLPEMVPVKPGKPVIMSQKLPDYGQENIYLFFSTKAESLQVIVEGDILYNSGKMENNIPGSHVVCIDSEMRGHIVTVVLTGYDKEGMEIQKVYAGTYTGLLNSAWKENGPVCIVGVLLLFFGVVLFIPWMLFSNVKRQKAVLLYGLWESLLIGLFFVMESRLFQVMTDWNYTLYLLKTFILILAAVLHLTVIDSNIFKKKILFLTSLGILFYSILFISVMVFQAFSLITVVTAYKAVIVCAMLGIFVYTVILAVGVYRFDRREGFVLLLANAVLLLGIIVHLIGFILRHGNMPSCIFIALGTLIYMLVVYVYGLKLTFTTPKKVSKGEKTEDEIKAEMVEQLNPNLLFASFSTLQNLIKNGSANSVKMIYYISVYLRDSLKAFEHSGEIISFEDEMEHIISYLQLQKTRNRSLNFSMECKETDFKIPRHTIEPMVENAVKHGISNHGNKGNVVVRTYQRAEGYAIQVIDDGIGFDRRTLKRKSSTSLLNLFSMLESSCQAQVELISKEDRGTVITIILPMLENDLLKENEENEG